jgi:hypothetical protein
MSDYLIVQFDKDDQELRTAIRDAFDDSAEFIESKNFDAGLSDYVQAIIPLVPAATQILVSYFSNPRAPKQSKRLVVTRHGEMTIEGYDRKDVERLVNKVREE